MKAVRIGLYADEAKRQAELSLCEAFGMEIYEGAAGFRYVISKLRNMKLYNKKGSCLQEPFNLLFI